MKKIPTLFRRDPEDMKHVLPEVTPGCEWVLAGEGVATRKYDGTCVMLGGNGEWWARRELKAGKPKPDLFLPADYDPATGKTVGWVPMETSSFAKWHAEALEDGVPYAAGTYELCGPKINGNPERFEHHRLIAHADAEPLLVDVENFEEAKALVVLLDNEHGVEGIVWHHPDGRMAKLKGRDFT